MTRLVIRFVLLLFIASFIFSPVAGNEVSSTQSSTVSLNLTATPPTPPSSEEMFHTLIITADANISQHGGYIANGVVNAASVNLSTLGDSLEIRLCNPIGSAVMVTTVEYMGLSDTNYSHPYYATVAPYGHPVTMYLSLSLIGYVPPTPGGGGGSSSPSVTPSNPSNPDVPINPVTPDTPSTPDTDDPYVPTLPPAGSVHSIVGLIPIIIGGAMLYLVFFWKRKVYRILTHHAKRHGEKPEKELLKATADALIRVIRSDEYAGWRKNSTLTSRLRSDIVRTLDEMQYPQVVPRDAVVAEILKSAKGRINRHRL